MVAVFSGAMGAGRKYLNAMAKPSSKKAKFSIVRARTNRLSKPVPASVSRGCICRSLAGPSASKNALKSSMSAPATGDLQHSTCVHRNLCVPISESSSAPTNHERRPVRASMLEDGIEVVVDGVEAEEGDVR